MRWVWHLSSRLAGNECAVHGVPRRAVSTLKLGLRDGAGTALVMPFCLWLYQLVAGPGRSWNWLSPVLSQAQQQTPCPVTQASTPLGPPSSSWQRREAHVGAPRLGLPLHLLPTDSGKDHPQGLREALPGRWLQPLWAPVGGGKAGPAAWPGAHGAGGDCAITEHPGAQQPVSQDYARPVGCRVF